MSESSEPSDNDERRWRQLVRGAFSIPNLVNDKNALEAVALLLLDLDLDGGAVDSSALEELRMDSRKIVTAFVKLGGEGNLDRYLVRLDLSSASDWDGQAEEILAAEILRESGLSSSSDHLQPAIRRLIEIAMTLARDKPYFDSDRRSVGSWVERRGDRRRRQ